MEIQISEVKQLHKSGVSKMYLHLDSWAQPGYDNQHPDYIPACEEAGGTAMNSAMPALNFCFPSIFFPAQRR